MTRQWEINYIQIIFITTGIKNWRMVQVLHINRLILNGTETLVMDDTVMMIFPRGDNKGLLRMVMGVMVTTTEDCL